MVKLPAGIADPETHLHRNLEALVDALNDTARLSPKALQPRTTVWCGWQRPARKPQVAARLPEIADEEVEDPVFLWVCPLGRHLFPVPV